MPIPTISHLQFFVLTVLTEQPVTKGSVIRDRLEFVNPREYTKNPSFYQLMKRMEVSGLVKGDYLLTPKPPTEDDPRTFVRERVYRLTSDGHDAMSGAIQFYLVRSKIPGLVAQRAGGDDEA